MTMETDIPTAHAQADERTRRTSAELLWAVAQVPGPDVDAFRRALASDPPIGWAVEVALGQRLGPMLWRAASAADAVDALGPWADAVRADHRVRWAQAELLIPKAMTLAIDALRGVGIDPLLFKGPATAIRYPEPGLRPMDDIDLLVPPDDADRAEAALTAAGWKLIQRPGEHYDAAFLHPEVPHLPVELHRALSTWDDDGTRLTIQRLWQARRPKSVLGVQTLVLPPEEDLIALAAHAAKPFHNFSRLIWAVDLAMLVHDEPDLDWDRLLALARTVRCRTAVAMGLRLATRLGAPVPRAALQIDANRYQRRGLAQVLDRSWPTTEPDLHLRGNLHFAFWEDPMRRAVMRYASVTQAGWRNIPGRIRYLYNHRQPPLRGPDPTR
jgi:hypothetical protein